MFIETKKRPQGESSPIRENTHEGLAEWAKILLKAAAAIEDHGHMKFDLGAPDRGFCLYGAISYAMFGDAMECYRHSGGKVYWTAADKVRKAAGVRDEMDWNNAPERTKEEVVSTLRRAALGG